ncbi:LysM peptidoglycan-binding domain-containing protein [Microbacterium sp. CFBP9034]|uniref:LysM peptidoglycan-binding domain-containing protein n=1 Tax=Microbacterium sp. CFBP9034 TaxID=3096540 RepID=UPI002A6B6470|nr:LysM peptidoglycan-binding domain-containing protein [Microbacterium sp. CFBP9034]MDY0910785.1 LysM peptidoglycan-binding domain-containing protein [Microbacterium sp. CFBP9034]
MNLAAKVTTGVAVLVVGGLVALAVPSVSAAYAEVSAWAVFQPTERRTAEPASEEDGDQVGEQTIDELGDGYVYVGNGTAIPKGSPAGCEDPAWIHQGEMSASLSGDLVDRGARDLAAGTAGLDDEGRIVSYTVAPGDALYAIGDRFCIANALTIADLNHTRTIQPGEVLLLHPDRSIPWVPYLIPAGAPAGYRQIPYQVAIEAMGTAADAGDVEAMRAIFADGLSSMFPNPAHADMIAQALDGGDLHVLRQMFP